MAGPVTITCGGCREAFPVPTRVLRIFGHQVLVVMDRSEVYGHMSRCEGYAEPASPAPVKEKGEAVATPEKLPDIELAGRINQLLDGEHYIAKGGSRACSMCGTDGPTCLTQLAKPGPQAACCPACGGGNTHIAPDESSTCAQWAERHGAKN